MPVRRCNFCGSTAGFHYTMSISGHRLECIDCGMLYIRIEPTVHSIPTWQIALLTLLVLGIICFLTGIMGF